MSKREFGKVGGGRIGGFFVACDWDLARAGGLEAMSGFGFIEWFVQLGDEGCYFVLALMVIVRVLPFGVFLVGY